MFICWPLASSTVESMHEILLATAAVCGFSILVAIVFFARQERAYLHAHPRPPHSAASGQASGPLSVHLHAAP